MKAISRAAVSVKELLKNPYFWEGYRRGTIQAYMIGLPIIGLVFAVKECHRTSAPETRAKMEAAEKNHE